jgi:activator of HSP90 ATPase
MKFTIKTTINALPEVIYNAWLSSKGHSEMTGGEANISDLTGDTFTTWDGYICGKNLLLKENKKIVQSWRTSEFEDHEPDSQIEIQLDSFAAAPTGQEPGTNSQNSKALIELLKRKGMAACYTKSF